MIVTQADQRRIVVDDDSRILQTDKRNEQSDTRSDGILQRHRQGIHNLFTQVGYRKQNKNQSLEQDRRQRKLPGISQCQTDRIGKERIQSHTRRTSERQFSIKAISSASEGRGNDSCRKSAPYPSGSARSVRI